MMNHMDCYRGIGVKLETPALLKGSMLCKHRFKVKVYQTVKNLPYNVIFHPLYGLCVLVKYSEGLELGPCGESNASNYTSGYEFALKATGQCLQGRLVGENAKLGTDCSKSNSKWQLTSNSGMHISTELTKNGTRACLDASPDGTSQHSVQVSNCRSKMQSRDSLVQNYNKQ
ncbi:hypothetical protein ABZP36_007171 [Zizania latifolia]